MKLWKRITAVAVLCSLGAALGSAVAATPAGWFVAGNAPKDYEFGTDPSARPDGGKAAYIKSVVGDSSGFGTLMQNVSPESYAGSRVRLSAVMRTKDANRAQMWLRVDGADRKVMGFDNMDSRPVTGTTQWRRYEIVVDVPAAAKNIAFGFFLFGTGTVWADDFALEVVDRTVPLTTSGPPEVALPKSPVNSSFED
ncbi:hypothetical protein HNQ60_002852 [Povalibacter uvarum]|uniref:Transcriptional regulator n=1 Tax=Povalibacter uvarum TaxID=732238 RepID=A0A841HL88_9GAMM|nr:hypothetical protein [Povalibacter uvarum]MBB6093971.1 hypothetical protein [Povalibacter uvarum]